MLIYHQCGHNYIWNVQSMEGDGVGEGLIISPVNIESDRIGDRIPNHVLARSWIDPQFYLPHDSKNKQATYPFFPGNVLEKFTTADFGNEASASAQACLLFQNDLGLTYHVIPIRYFDDLPDDFFQQLDSLFVEPFLSARQSLDLRQPVLLTIIAKPVHLESDPLRDELLSWATGYQEITGIYLIFDNSFHSKQIKDPGYLAGMLRFVRALRLNHLEVHVGYSGLEGLLLSVADPTSVSIGSYENLRSFGTLRLETRETGVRRGPRPRIYSGRLLQWIEDTYMPPIRELVQDWRELVDESRYKAYLLEPNNAISFQRSEIYKHYFRVFSEQVAALPEVARRGKHLRDRVAEAQARFDRIGASGVVLDSDSDGSHLPAWLNALTMFERRPE